MSAAKEERLELLRRQSMRRVMHRDLSAGWQAWSELYQARKYAMERLRTCANRLRTPELSDALSHWLASMERARRDAELREMMMREAAAKGEAGARVSDTLVMQNLEVMPSAPMPPPFWNW